MGRRLHDGDHSAGRIGDDGKAADARDVHRSVHQRTAKRLGLLDGCVAVVDGDAGSGLDETDGDAPRDSDAVGVAVRDARDIVSLSSSSAEASEAERKIAIEATKTNKREQG